jgi:hypothetical protein
MKIGKKAMVGWALGGFSVGTILTIINVCSGDSLLFSSGNWAHIALFPGRLVGIHTFDLLGYSTAITLACLAVGLVYSAITSAIVGALSRIRMA